MPDDMTTAVARDLGITELSADEQKQVIEQFGEVALKAATLAVIGRLDEAKRGEFAALAEAGDPAKLKIFLDAEVPDHEAVVKDAVAAEIARFRESQADAPAA